jgi:hypothetical protein
MPKQLTQAVIEEWIRLLPEGKFNIRDIWQEVGIESTKGKKHLRVILKRLEEKGVVSPNGGGGIYRKIDYKAPKIDWRSADPNNFVPLKWPFGIENYALMYPKNVAIVAGAKQEGKTTFLYEFIRNNMYDYKIDLYNSETGPEQMKDRFLDMGIPIDAPFEVYERYDNFADVIDPEAISVIDYLDTNSEFYLIGAEIDAIFRKLTTGIAVIGMQVPPPQTSMYKGKKQVVTRDYAYGGGVTAKRAFIYITLLNKKMKIKHVKKPATRYSPENMMFSYEIDEHGCFANIRPYRPYEEEGGFPGG